MATTASPRTYGDYRIGWICAIEPEMVAARAMMDTLHPTKLPKATGDTNNYLYGQIGPHNIVIASLPSGTYGVGVASRVATNMLRTFHNLDIRLMVGIGGGVPVKHGRDAVDIRLGDVVISEPNATSPGIVQYTLVKTIQGQLWPSRTGTLDKPPEEIRTAVANLKGRHAFETNPLAGILADVKTRHPDLDSKYSYQGQDRDVLFESQYKHRAQRDTCGDCDRSLMIKRSSRISTSPRIHYGTIGSGDTLVKDSVTRDYWHHTEGIICFEMEAAGLDSFHCLAIRGVCDYADSHKNKDWQEYAAMVAAAYAKDLVLELPPPAPRATIPSPPAGNPSKAYWASHRKQKLILASDFYQCHQYRAYEQTRLSKHFTGRHIVLQDLEARLLSRNINCTSSHIVVLYGPGGIGKSQIALKYASLKEALYDFICVVNCESKQTVEKELTEFAVNILQLVPSDQNACLNRLRTAMSAGKSSWLLVFDGYDSASRSSMDWFPLDKYLPTPSVGVLGHILITSICDGASDLGEGLRIASMSSIEARQLLLSTSKLEHTDVREAVIDDICDRLDRIPLAVDVAGSYLRQQQRDGIYAGRENLLLETYLRRFSTTEIEFKELLFSNSVSMPSGSASYYRTIYKAWLVSFAAVRAVNTAAADLFLLLSFLDPTAVSSESAYIRSAFVTRQVWDIDGNIQNQIPGERTLPGWLYTLVGHQEVSADGKPGLSSIATQSAIDILVSYSIVRRSIHFGNGFEVWTMHGVFRDCARIYCDEETTLEMSSSAINLLIENRAGVLTESPLLRPEAFISISSWLLMESFLADTVFMPFKSIIGDIYCWDRILVSLAAAVPSKFGISQDMNLLEARDGLAFLAVTIGHRLNRTDPSLKNVANHISSAKQLRDAGFDTQTTTMLYLLYRLEYFTVGRGLHDLYPNPFGLVSLDEMDTVLEYLDSQRDLDACNTINGLLLISAILVSMHRLFVYNETDDNPNLVWKDESIEKLKRRWLNLRHTAVLRKYSRKTEDQIKTVGDSEVLRRARARLFLVFAREVEGLPRYEFGKPTAFNQIRRLYSESTINDILFLTIVAFYDLQTIGIEHLCAVGASMNLAFNFCGFTSRSRHTSGIFRPEANFQFSLRTAGVSSCLGRLIRVAMLEELVANHVSPRSKTTSKNCVSCNCVLAACSLFVHNQSIEDGACFQAYTWHLNLSLGLQTRYDHLKSIERQLDRFEANTVVMQYTDQEQLEKMVEKFKARHRKIFQLSFYGQLLENPMAIVERSRNELLSQFSNAELFGEFKMEMNRYKIEVESQLASQPPIDIEGVSALANTLAARLCFSVSEHSTHSHQALQSELGLAVHSTVQLLAGSNVSRSLAWLGRRYANAYASQGRLEHAANEVIRARATAGSAFNSQKERYDMFSGEHNAVINQQITRFYHERNDYLVQFVITQLDLSGMLD